MTDTIHSLKNKPIVGEVKLTIKEIQALYNNITLIENIQQPIIIKQSSGGGIGLATTLEYTCPSENGKMETYKSDITDYAAW